MKRLLLPLVLFASAQLAGAGLVLVQEIDQSGGPMPGKTRMTITASGDKARVDIGKDISSIVDSRTGTVTSLLHAQKMAMKLPEGTFDSIKHASKDQSTKPDLKPTGKTEEINGFQCEEYIGTIKGLKVAFWTTRDVKNQKEILGQLAKLSGGNDPFKAALQDGGDFPGFPIRTVIDTKESGTSTMTVVSIKDEDVPDSAFEIPAGYKTMDMPKMSNPGGGAPAMPMPPSGQ